MQGGSELMDRRKGATPRSNFFPFVFCFSHDLLLIFPSFDSHLTLFISFYFAPHRSFLRGESVRVL
jgi:hypothetical protein